MTTLSISLPFILGGGGSSVFIWRLPFTVTICEAFLTARARVLSVFFKDTGGEPAINDAFRGRQENAGLWPTDECSNARECRGQRC